ncbi:MAG: AEC family transporter [Firmicutes bacterium]|nr:AEC family transporter [Bacillota bacterium]
MATIYAVFDKLVALFMLVMAGYFLRRKNIVSEGFSTGISGFLTKVVLPVFFVMAMQIEFTPEKFQNGLKVYVFSIILILLATAIGFVTASICGVKGADKGVWIYGCMLPNHAFIGFPVMAVVFGEEGLFYAAFANAALNTIAFSLGVVIVGLYAQDKSKKKSLKQLLLTPMNVGTVVGIILFVLDIQLPGPVADSFTMITNTMSAMAMLFVGMVLSKYPIMSMFKGIKNYEITLVRLVIIPVLVYFIMLPFRGGVIDNVAFGILVLSHAVPVGSIVATVAAEYSDDPASASRYIFISTLLCLVSIPLISLLII